MYKSTHFSLIEEHPSNRDKKMIVVHRGVGVNDPDLEATFTDPVHLTLSPAHMRNWSARISNGKSSIVEERLYSFFFAFFQQKNEASFFLFTSFTQLGTKSFVLLRSW